MFFRAHTPMRVHARGQAAALKQPNGRETSSFAATLKTVKAAR